MNLRVNPLKGNVIRRDTLLLTADVYGFMRSGCFTIPCKY